MTGRYQRSNDENIVWHIHPVQREDRERLHKHRSAVLWFTGLSGAGKSTLASALEQALYSKGVSTYLLDGDNVRHGLCRDLGFRDDERRENIRRVGEVAKLMLDAGLIVLSALISPHYAERQMVRDMLPVGRFIEVFVDTPLAICQARDPKGLYHKVRSGQLHNFTGIDSIYQPPQQPEIHLNGTQLITQLTTQLLEVLKERVIISFSNPV
ncbi:adenylyl-sulfate kinase [Candidatus Palibaumannia cicadellinicola]|uniref:Adenylyl-sulfate kinase n=1 Tax=Candidatus Palibaumannia cicadellinicola TaxID=186490 RepID=A0A088MY35_9GAMM|nr:adenylyl-sulfate kinase [Candidatus Baumannia cicadellinicola]AIN47124.1 Adenylylsulfate kinase [Candidatus Baumannia cicadellinicola]